MNAPLPESCRRYLDDFARHRDRLPGGKLPWLAKLRDEAMRQFAAMGFPTLHDEDWKYTSVAPVENGRFTLAPQTIEEVDEALIDSLALPDAHLLVFVDGRHAPSLSRPGALPAGVTVTSLATLLERLPGGLPAQLHRPGSAYPSPFAALNAACMSDGACIHLARGAHLDAPIQLLFVSATNGLAAHTRNLILADADSSACILEHHAASGAPANFTNTVTDIVLGPRAQVMHHKLQQESRAATHIASINADLDADSRFTSTSFALGAGLSRAEIHATLDGEGAECTLDGLYLGDGRRHIDHHTRIDHKRPRGTSRELYKGVLTGGSRAVFNGKVVVHPDAQKTDALQINRNLLLSALAEVDTKPQLEIWADDVKCSHGATVGQLDADQIFYLRSRGIDEAAARATLTRAFAAEMVERIELQSLRERIDTLLRERLEVLP